MNQPESRLSRPEFALLIGATIAMLMFREWVRRDYLQTGVEPELAKQRSFLLAVPVFLVLASPVFYRSRTFVCQLFRWHSSSLRFVWHGLLIGLACRIIWWVAITLNATLGFGETGPHAIALQWSFSPPAMSLVLISLLTMSIVTPVYEELVFRGFVQTYLSRHGVAFGIITSAAFFMLVHMPANHLSVFSMGILLAAQFHLSGSLWMPIATHATFNSLARFDWHWSTVHWNPNPAELPQWGLSLGIGTIGVLAFASIFTLLRALKKER